MSVNELSSMKSAGLSKVSNDTRGWKTLYVTVSRQLCFQGNNEEHEKATKPIARFKSHPHPVRRTSPCLSDDWLTWKSSRQRQVGRPIYAERI
jgi:hypothetical protein